MGNPMLPSNTDAQGLVGGGGGGLPSPLPPSLPPPLGEQGGVGTVGVAGGMAGRGTVASGTNQAGYTKLWEGILAGQRQRMPVYICHLEGYRQNGSLDDLASEWPQSMQIVRLISADHMNRPEFAGNGELLVFRPLQEHYFLRQMADRRLCAVVRLPAHTLLLAPEPDRPGCLIGRLFPKDMVVLAPSGPSSNANSLASRAVTNPVPNAVPSRGPPRPPGPP